MNRKLWNPLPYLMVMMFTIYCATISILAATPDMDNGGGSMGGGTSSNRWSVGHDGVRVTVFDGESVTPVTPSVDLTDISPSSQTFHFGKVNKASYVASGGLSLQLNGYHYINPTQPLPEIINASGRTNLEAIKSYFTDEQVLRSLAGYVGMEYDDLVNGEHKIMVEPLAYFTYSGNYMCATATEAALYDRTTGNDLWYWMQSLTHKNLPLAIFLENGDLGFSAWSGSTTSNASNSNIIAYLGIGAVTFDEPPPPPEVEIVDYIYRTDTEVITSVTIRGGQSDPDDPTTVTFRIDGTDYDVGNVYYPEGASQLAWVKWTTPEEEQIINITVTVDGPGGTTEGSIRCQIEDLDKNPPPNPVADDRNDGFSASSVPSRDVNTSSNWTTYTPWWQPHWVWTGLSWVDLGWWEFDTNLFSASLSGSMDLISDDKSPTATSSGIKSGYGYQQEVTSRTTTNGSSAVSQTPNAVTYFPEFGYETYWRLLERMRTGLTAKMEFQKNKFSTYENRTHFTPIWYPDGTYNANTWLIDVWTPTGMLSLNLTDSISISGNLWDDWHIGPQ